jgi:hypothetical protein
MSEKNSSSYVYWVTNLLLADPDGWTPLMQKLIAGLCFLSPFRPLIISQPISLESDLMLSSYPLLGLPSDRLLKCCSNRILYSFLISPIPPHNYHISFPDFAILTLREPRTSLSSSL